MSPNTSTKKPSSKPHPMLRKEGKAQNLHIKIKPSSHKSSAKANFKNLKTVFPKMTVMSSPASAGGQQQQQQSPAIVIEPVITSAASAREKEEQSSEEDDDEDDDDNDNSSDVGKAATATSSKQMVDNDEDDDEDDEDDDDEDNDDEEEEEDEDEDEEEEMKLKEDSNVPGSLHTQYPGNFRVPDVYPAAATTSSHDQQRSKHHKSNSGSAVPPLPLSSSKPSSVPSTTTLTVGKERALKQILLYKMGMVTPEDRKEEYAKLYTVKNSLSELQDVYNQLKVAASMAKSINWSKQICNLGVQGFETLMMKQKVVDMSLMEGWSMNTSLMLEDGEFDDMLSEMVGGAAADYHPLTRMAITLFFGGVGYYFTQKATRKHVGAAGGSSAPSFVNPMTSFMNGIAQGGGMGAGGVPSTNNGSAPYPMPWYPPGQAQQPQPQQPHIIHQHASAIHPQYPPIHREQTSAIDMQQKIQEREYARQQQSNASMIHASTAASVPVQPPSQVATAAAVPVTSPTAPPVPSISSMNNAALRYTADKIKDYHAPVSSVKRKRTPSPSVKDCDSDSAASDSHSAVGGSDQDENDDEDEDSEDDEEDDSEAEDTPPMKKSKVENGSHGKTKTASMLGSATLQAKIDKAIALQKQGRASSSTAQGGGEPARASAIGTAAIPVTSAATAYVPLKRQTVDGPPPPMNPRGGEQMSMFSSESIDTAQLAPLSSMVSVL